MFGFASPPFLNGFRRNSAHTHSWAFVTKLLFSIFKILIYFFFIQHLIFVFLIIFFTFIFCLLLPLSNLTFQGYASQNVTYLGNRLSQSKNKHKLGQWAHIACVLTVWCTRVTFDLSRSFLGRASQKSLISETVCRTAKISKIWAAWVHVACILIVWCTRVTFDLSRSFQGLTS
jgi:hypothetical protein